ncbi:hypothetical protein [Planctopirus hydrillae]|nr:hypothetical protein [Planctopirus hydrillae]
MAEKGLTVFWIRSPLSHAPLGFGVTAFSLDDAVEIITALDYGQYLTNDLAELQIQAGITVAELDQPHVIANMGPISVRGMRYPFVALGVPLWAEERRSRRST